jgi:hypothetical protein
MTKPVKQLSALAAVNQRLGLAGTISSTLRERLGLSQPGLSQPGPASAAAS